VILERAGVFELIGRDHVHTTAREAVLAAEAMRDG
jgi:hypothetical protein